jgi:hypothetical protein
MGKVYSEISMSLDGFITGPNVHVGNGQVVDDNNYPFSNGRRPGVSDDTEFILPEALNLE